MDELNISRAEAYDVIHNLLHQLECGNEQITMPAYTLVNGNDPIGIKNVNFSSECAYKDSDSRSEGWQAQRLDRGFDDTELWNLDHTILKFIRPRLAAFAKHSDGRHPADVSGDEWVHALSEMLFAVDWYLDEHHVEWLVDDFGQLIHDDNGNLVPTPEATRAMAGWQSFTDNFFGLWT